MADPKDKKTKRGRPGTRPVEREEEPRRRDLSGHRRRDQERRELEEALEEALRQIRG